MEFFTHQDHARRLTRRLLVLYAVAVCGVVAAVYVIFTAAYGLVVHETRRARDPEFRARTGWTWGVSPPFITAAGRSTWWDPLAFAGLSGITVVIIGVGAGMQSAAFARGGRAVAELLGGTAPRPDDPDPDLRRLRNVVEEMAIASGCPVPEVYVLEGERSINAFAAGRRPAEAVIGITRGALRQLTRDELQGVIAHEFSHILNGDMRLNMRLGVLTHGILFLAVAGHALIRGAFHLPRGSRHGRDGGGQLAAMLLMLGSGLALVAVGSVGHAFAWLIQAAVSRQREFLADAAAVQFTRHPAGIAGALAKAAGAPRRLASAHAGELGHFLFCGSAPQWLGNWTATHPPLEERIRRIDPDFLEHWRPEPPADTADPPVRRPPLPVGGTVVLGSLLAQGTRPSQAHAPLRPRHEHLAYAVELIRTLPAPVLEACRSPFSARALVLALLPAPEDLAGIDPALRAEMGRLDPHLRAIDPRARLPVIDLAIPALRLLSPAQYVEFRALTEAAIASDAEISLFEFALQQCLKNQLDAAFSQTRPTADPPALTTLAAVWEELRVVLGALAYARRDPARAGESYAAGVAALEVAELDAALPPAGVCGLAEFAVALEQLNRLTPGLRRRVLYAAAQTVAVDGVLSVEEAELIRALGDALNTPVPPFLSRLGSPA